MKNPFKEFRERLKVKGTIKPSESIKETPEMEAKRLALQLDSVFVNAPMFKPYGEGCGKVQLNEVCIDYIQSILNTDNQLILNSEFYKNIENGLRELLSQNENGIKVDDIVALSGDVKRLYYSFQTQKYWEEKPF